MLSPLLRIGVAGAGHFGRYHALKVVKSVRAQLSGIYDVDEARARTVGWETGVPALGYEHLLTASDAIIIAAPAEAHYRLAMLALSAGKHALVEKPIAANSDQADEMAELAKRRGLVLQIGHLERFSAAYQTMSSHVVAPLYIEAMRIAPFRPRGTDVSVILDLMIHDLDLVLALVASDIVNVDAVGAPIISEYEDIANARLQFRNGCVATITASRVSPRTERKMRVFTQDSYITADFSIRTLNIVNHTYKDTEKGCNAVSYFDPNVSRVTWEDHDALSLELAAFEAAILDKRLVAVDAAAGQRALAVAELIEKSVRKNRIQMEHTGLIRSRIINSPPG